MQDDDIKKKIGDAPVKAENSRYYHPTLNPTGAPPPGKQAAGVIAAPSIVEKPAPQALNLNIPLPKAPPPTPRSSPLASPSSCSTSSSRSPATSFWPTAWSHSFAASPWAPSWGVGEQAGAGPGSAAGPPGALPPPLGPPPGMPMLPPPAGPPPRLPPPTSLPPGMYAMPPPMGPPPGMPPPMGPPPGLPPMGMPPPGAPPPSTSEAAARKAAGVAVASTITGSSTVIKRPLAQNDKVLTSMVPASVRVKRDEKKHKPSHRPAADSSFGFGLAPVQKTHVPIKPLPAPVPAVGADTKDDDQRKRLQNQGFADLCAHAGDLTGDRLSRKSPLQAQLKTNFKLHVEIGHPRVHPGQTGKLGHKRMSWPTEQFAAPLKSPLHPPHLKLLPDACLMPAPSRAVDVVLLLFPTAV
eukprot:gene20698-27502_t